jgi:hypothetical protein
MRLLFPLFLTVVLFSGCATKPIDYYYGNYEKTYYHSKKDGTPSSVANYKESLEDIIEKSGKKGLRVPPGIYCEYGYLLAKQGSPDAERYFDLEVTTYPESARFVALVRSQLKQGQP